MRKPKRPPLTPAEIDQAVRWYTVDGLGTPAIAERLNSNNETVRTYLNRAGVETPYGPKLRKYSHNADAFRVRSPEMAYWLGFINADGGLYADPKRRARQLRLSVGLQLADADHLRKLAAFLSFDGAIIVGQSKIGSKSYPKATLRLTGNSLCESLMSLGVLPNKTTREVVPDGFEDDADYWRGMIDGDGYLRRYSRGSKMAGWESMIGVCGSAATCEGFARFVERRFPGDPINVQPLRRIKRTHVYGQRSRDVIRLLYTDPQVALDRKAATAADILAFFEQYAAAKQLRAAPAGCSVDGCDRPHEARGLCEVHYKHHWNAGTLPPLLVRPPQVAFNLRS